MGREVIRKKRVGCQFSVRFVRGNVLLLGSSDPAMSIIGISRKYSTQEYKITSGPNIENDFLGGWWINPVNIFWFSWNLIGVQCKGYIHQVFFAILKIGLVWTAPRPSIMENYQGNNYYHFFSKVDFWSSDLFGKSILYVLSDLSVDPT